MSWQELSDHDREREYSPSSCVGGDITPFLDAYATRSAAARAACTAAGLEVRRLHYGDAPRQVIDFVHPRTPDPSPVLVFIHGGYWQELSPDESFFAGADAVRHGVAHAAVGYTLAPDASLDEIVAEVRAAVVHLVAHADELGIDPGRVVVSGSSAGAHLAAMVAIESSPDGVPDWRPAGVVLVSGIYELAPLVGTSINEALGLDHDDADRNSPAFAELTGFPPALVAFGDNETVEFKRQSADFANRIGAAGGVATVHEIVDRNHFDIILDLAAESEDLGRRVLAMVAATEPDRGR